MSGKSSASTTGATIVEASSEISQAAALLILTETAQPQKSYCQVNRHVKELMAHQAHTSYVLTKHQAVLSASL